MIHATIAGVIVSDAIYTPAQRDQRRAHQSRVLFSMTTRRSTRSQVVECSLQGRGADVLHAHLETGTRVIAVGSLHLSHCGGEPHLVLAVHSLDLPDGMRSDEDDSHGL